MDTDRQFRDLKTYLLVQEYNRDPGVVYSLTAEQLQTLLFAVGEMEPIIDAINVLNGASVEQRAEDIGCEPEDFQTYDGDDQIVQVEELELDASFDWSYGC